MTRRSLSLLFAYALVMTLVSPGVHAAEHSRRSSDSQSSTPSLKSPSTPADLADGKACTLCSLAEAKGPGSNPHAKLALDHGGKEVNCEEYHGADRAHVVSGDENNLSLTASRHRPRTGKDPRGGRHSGENRWIQERG